MQEEFSAWKRNLEEKHREAPKRYRGYEALLDTYDDPSVPIPTGRIRMRRDRGGGGLSENEGYFLREMCQIDVFFVALQMCMDAHGLYSMR